MRCSTVSHNQAFYQIRAAVTILRVCGVIKCGLILASAEHLAKTCQLGHSQTKIHG